MYNRRNSYLVQQLKVKVSLTSPTPEIPRGLAGDIASAHTS
jgi:hypothetical protein